MNTATPLVDLRPQISGFARLDQIVCRRSDYGQITALLPETAFASLARHLVRRLARCGRSVFTAGLTAVADPWRQLAQRVAGTGHSEPTPAAPRWGEPQDLRGPPADDPVHSASLVAQKAAGGVLIVGLGRETSWGRALHRELVQLCRAPERQLLLVILRPPAALPVPPTLRSRTERAGSEAHDLILEVDATEDTRLWWEAVVDGDARLAQAPFASLETLDSWWETTTAQAALQPPGATAPLPVSDRAAELLGFAVLAEQLEAGQIPQLATAAVKTELVRSGLVTVERDGSLSPRAGLNLGDLAAVAAEVQSPAKLAQLAAVIEGSARTGGDGWRLMRASELYAAAGEAARAEELACLALRQAQDTAARDDLWQRWEAALGRLAESDGPGHLDRMIRAAQLALVSGDGDRADVLATEALRLDGDRFDVLFLHGRACTARGDVTTAALSLERALSRAPGPSERAQALGVMAQVQLLAGNRERAAQHAAEAIELAADPATQLSARNVLGKLLLAREEWQQAEAHFAADAYEAARAGHREAELRARLNRGIAVLYLGRREEARGMLEAVLADGERLGIRKAVTYTLSNLATIAILQHSYQEALELSERAITVRRQIGERIGLVQPITNLAELRLRLGLLNEAEQALRFGLAACGSTLPLSRRAYFAKVAASIHLERGHTDQAAKDIATALSGALGSGEQALSAQCHRISARIALEDGDVVRAQVSLEAAAEVRHTAVGQAELAVLQASWLRASGRPFQQAAGEALALAQKADDFDCLREAYVLLHHAYRNDGQLEQAARCLAAAAAARDRWVELLPAALRPRLLGKRGLAELAALEADLASQPCRAAAEPPAGGEPPLPPEPEPETVCATGSSTASDRRLIGDSPAMRSLLRTIERVASTDATVLVRGETGTGKELVAEAIHRGSSRRHGPLVKVNCSALVETLLLSELFGHERGAFTGASSRRRGRFEIAAGGTLFLDEIGDISHRTQVALLRVLQDGTYERVGGCQQLRSDVRVVCATHRDLKAMVARGEFREDLYYRLCGVEIEVPPLRQRLTDLPLLAQGLLAQAEQTSGVKPRPLSRAALQALSHHSWPGNVRELENALRVAALFAAGQELTPADFVSNVEGLRGLGQMAPATIAPPGAAAPLLASPELPDSLPPPSSSADLIYAEVREGTRLADMKRKLEQECICRALSESGGNITRAAALLGMKRPRLSQLVKQYQLTAVPEDIKQ